VSDFICVIVIKLAYIRGVRREIVVGEFTKLRKLFRFALRYGDHSKYIRY
jgi:hypothetical protein